MPTLIKHRALATDHWIALPDDAEVPSSGAVLVSLKRWQAERDVLTARTGAVGVLLQPADDPGEISGDLGRLALVAVAFPAFTDGRGYSIARLLRDRYGFQGELRAVGDVLRDQLFLLARCGFDSFALKDGQDATAALAAFGDFSEVYQSASDRPGLFTRRFAEGAGASR